MPTNGNFYRFDDVLVDCENFRVQKNGQNITLTPRAFDVLVFLSKNGGRVIEKQEIFDEVWKETFVSDNALTKVIKEIRHALEDDAGHPRYIETVPKRGYRLIAELSKPDEFIEPRHKVDAASLIRESQTETDSPPTWTRSYSNRLVLFTGLIVVAAGLLSLYFLTGSKASDIEVASEPIDSIAILPFENATQDPNTEYLSDGITESLINDLSQLPNLKVMSKGSVFRYKGKEQDAHTIGSELNVKAVLTGSVKLVGDNLVINVRLDDARDDQHIWGEQYVRKFADILNVQNEITQEVSTNLRVKLTSEDQQELAKYHTNSIDAYQLYLKGQYVGKSYTEDDLWKSIEYYNQAIALDPNYALAYDGLSASYGVLGNAHLSPNETYPKAKAYAEKALSIDETLAQSHVEVGHVRMVYDWNWANAEKEFKLAQSIDPNNADAHLLYGYLLNSMGRFDEAQTESKRALELDPLTPMTNTDLGVDFYYARQYDDAITQLEKSADLDSRFFPTYFWLGAAFEQKKMYPEAIEALKKGLSENENEQLLIASLGNIYAQAGERDKANAALDELFEISKRHYVNPYWFALIYAGLGDTNQTFEWLEKAYKERHFFLIWLKVEPRFDPFRGDPRFNDLLQRIGL